MKAPYLLHSVGLPVLVLAGLGVGAAAAKYGAAESEIPAELRNAPHCRFADIPAQVQSPEAVKAYEDAEPPLWSDLGTLSYPITTKSKEAQSYFDQGLRMATNFNHAEARRAFRKAQRLDPECATCFAFEALVLGPNINVPMDPEVNGQAVSAVRKAQSLAAGASEKEQALIAAIAARYSDDAAERPKLDAAFADAMAALSDKYPDDLEFMVIAAEAGMDTQPWDYWEPGGKARKDEPRMCRPVWKGYLPSNRITPRQSTFTSIWSRRPTGRSERNRMRINWRPSCRAPAISCICRATSTIALAVSAIR